MDFSSLLCMIFSLAGAFAALLWLRPGKQEAVRYALIVICFGGLYYILRSQTSCTIPLPMYYQAQLIPLLVFLLGIYMLKCPWRRVLLSLGVFYLITILGNIFSNGELSSTSLLYSFCVYLSVLWYWLFIHWSTRKDERLRPAERIYAAAAFVWVECLVISLCRYATYYLTTLQNSFPLPGWLLTAPLLLLCLWGFLSFVLLQPRRRSFCIAAVAVTLSTVVGCTTQHIINQATDQINLTEALIVSIEENDYTGMQRCLQQGANVNKALQDLNQEGEPAEFYPLIHATARGHYDMVAALLEAGADVHVRRRGGDTALLSACIYDGEHDNTPLVELLLLAGSDVNAANDDGCTALITAAMTCAPQRVVKALLQAGAYVNHRDRDADTALHYAAQLPSNESQGAHLACMRLLLAHGAVVNVRDCDGETPLLQCARDGFTEGVRLLLEHGAAPTLRNKEGRSPLELARQNGHQEIAELLMTHRH